MFRHFPRLLITPLSLTPSPVLPFPFFPTTIITITRGSNYLVDRTRLSLPSIFPSCWRQTRRPFSTSASSAQRTPAPADNMAAEYRLKGIPLLEEIRNFEKVEADVDGIEGGKVLVLRLNNEIHAISPRCTHYGAPLKRGVLQSDGHIRCQWHGGEGLTAFCSAA
jgi:Rieske [2Fe-2S] domain